MMFIFDEGTDWTKRTKSNAWDVWLSARHAADLILGGVDQNKERGFFSATACFDFNSFLSASYPVLVFASSMLTFGWTAKPSDCFEEKKEVEKKKEIISFSFAEIMQLARSYCNRQEGSRMCWWFAADGSMCVCVCCVAKVGSLQDRALLVLRLPLPRQQGCASGMLEYLPDPFVGLGGTFKIFLGPNLLADIFGLWWERKRIVSHRCGWLDMYIVNGVLTCSGVTGF